MKATPLLLIALTAVAFARGPFLYEEAGGDLSLRAKSGMLNSPTDSLTKTFKLIGGVHAVSRKTNLTIDANQVDGTIQQIAKESRISHAVAIGSVRLVKSSPKGSSTMTAAKADYTDRMSDALVILTGGVRITSSSQVKRESIVITGPHGQAILDPPNNRRSKNGLRTATLEGGVRVQVDQASGGQITATGRTLTLDYLTNPSTVTLSGGVQVRGSQASGFGNLQNAQKAVLKLNEKGEVIGTQVSS